MVGFIPLITTQLAQHTHDTIIVFALLTIPFPAALRRSRIVYVVAESRPLALLVRRLRVRRLAVDGKVGGVEFGGTAVAGTRSGLDGDGGALLEA